MTGDMPIDFSFIAHELKPFILHVLNQYKKLQATDVPQDAKGFSSYHLAGKAALSHLQMLLAFIREGQSDADDEGLFALTQEAREAFNGLGGYDDA